MIFHDSLNYFSAEAATISLSDTPHLEHLSSVIQLVGFFFPNPKILHLTES